MSPVMISSIAKFVAGVNRMVVENVEIEDPEINPTLIVKNRFDGLVKIGIDETSYKKGHKYITIVINHESAFPKY